MKGKKNSFILPILAVFLATVGFSSSSAVGQNANGESKATSILKQGKTYYCDSKSEHPTLVFRSDLGNVRLIEFRSKKFGEEWQPLERCREIADRALEFDKLGIISYLTVEEMPNGIKAICISKIDADHLQLQGTGLVRLLMTLKPSDDPQEILEEVKGMSSLSSDGNPLVH